MTDYLSPFKYAAVVVSVVDGDTLDVIVDRGMYDYKGSAENPVPIRLLGCNAAEKGTPGGDAAHANLAALLPPGTILELVTAKPDKYAPRWDAAVLYRGADRQVRSLVADLLEQGWVAAWNGQGTKPVPPYPPVAS